LFASLSRLAASSIELIGSLHRDKFLADAGLCSGPWASHFSRTVISIPRSGLTGIGQTIDSHHSHGSRDEAIQHSTVTMRGEAAQRMVGLLPPTSTPPTFHFPRLESVGTKIAHLAQYFLCRTNASKGNTRTSRVRATARTNSMTEAPDQERDTCTTVYLDTLRPQRTAKARNDTCRAGPQLPSLSIR
jgi:hypothetical protein